MQRPRNRQGRGASLAERGRGRGRGRVSDRQLDYSSNIPNISQVVPGGFVSIVLKVDQPTGKEVQGIVADVLTNGNHPRGIKVRLVDGRVGRVQKMATEDEAKTGSDGLNGMGRNGEQGGLRYAPRTVGRLQNRDLREEEGMGMPATGYSLGDFLPVGHPLREDDSTPRFAIESSVPLSTCPVCGDFEGDELAVSHHVSSHFE